MLHRAPAFDAMESDQNRALFCNRTWSSVTSAATGSSVARTTASSLRRCGATRSMTGFGRRCAGPTVRPMATHTHTHIHIHTHTHTHMWHIYITRTAREKRERERERESTLCYPSSAYPPSLCTLALSLSLSFSLPLSVYVISAFSVFCCLL